MKKGIAILCAAILAGLLLCGCSEKKDSMEQITDDIATVASEAVDRFRDMVTDGTVDDGDGNIGDDTRAAEPPTDPTASEDTAPTDDTFI